MLTKNDRLLTTGDELRTILCKYMNENTSVRSASFIAKKINVHRSTIGNILNGKTIQPSTDKIISICRLIYKEDDIVKLVNLLNNSPKIKDQIINNINLTSPTLTMLPIDVEVMMEKWEYFAITNLARKSSGTDLAEIERTIGCANTDFYIKNLIDTGTIKEENKRYHIDGNIRYSSKALRKHAERINLLNLVDSKFVDDSINYWTCGGVNKETYIEAINIMGDALRKVRSLMLNTNNKGDINLSTFCSVGTFEPEEGVQE